jgi:hypothetical protein
MPTDSLRNWLRKAPKPTSLRIKTQDGEEQSITLGTGRTRWNAAEETLATCGAISVSCLDKDGKVLRGKRLADEELEVLGNDPAEEAAVKSDKEASKAILAQAAMLDAYGKRINEAHEVGAAAASSAQDKLVGLVTVLSNQLTISITNIQNLSVNLSNVMRELAQLQGGGDDSGGSDKMQLLAGLLMRSMGGATAPEATNGKAGK